MGWSRLTPKAGVSSLENEGPSIMQPDPILVGASAMCAALHLLLGGGVLEPSQHTHFSICLTACPNLVQPLPSAAAMAHPSLIPDKIAAEIQATAEASIPPHDLPRFFITPKNSGCKHPLAHLEGHVWRRSPISVASCHLTWILKG